MSDAVSRERDRYRGALVGAVVGDALGAPFEGHPGPLSRRAMALIGRSDAALMRYTDDTALTFALAASLVDRGRLDLDHVAGTFAATYVRDPYRGYGAGAAHLLARIAGGDDWRDAAAAQFGGQGSFGNGGAMRVAPVALHAAGDPATAAALGRLSATVTHTHAHAVDAAGVQAVAVAVALADRPATREELLAPVRDLAATAELRAALDVVAALPEDAAPSDVAAAVGSGILAVEAVPAAIAAAVLGLGSFGDSIRFAIGMGGDTDTVATMAGAIAGARSGEAAIPSEWLERVEGVPTARDLADRLLRRRPPASGEHTPP